MMYIAEQGGVFGGHRYRVFTSVGERAVEIARFTSREDARAFIQLHSNQSNDRENNVNS